MAIPSNISKFLAGIGFTVCLAGHGAAMVIESLQLLYHLACFRCCVCQAPLGNGLCGTDVRVRNTKLHCTDCYSNDEAGVKLSRV
uniref:F-box protein 20 n=1 Tax=Rhipicephalus zambeziensis TaxID=60191 RepID=A0A224YMP3_9ACAR